VMTTIDDILAFEWPKTRHDQRSAMRRLLALIDTLHDEWASLLVPVLQINQDTLPSTGDWQNLWLAEGNTLPIPTGARLLWYNTALQNYGGSYTSIDGDIVRAEGLQFAGKSDFVPFKVVDSTSEVGYNGTTLTDLNNPITFTIEQSAYLIFRIPLLLTLSGTGITQYTKLNYSLNGVTQITNPVATQPGLLVNELITISAATSWYFASSLVFMHPTLLTPGTYTLALSGLVTSTLTGKWNFAHRALPQTYSGSAPYYKAILPPAFTWELIYQ
jgi:hypothetical protein